MIESLNQIRARANVQLPVQQKLTPLLFSLCLGALLGFLAKRYDSVPIIGEIGTYLGGWVLIATVLSAWSRSPRAAALQVLVFFAAMLTVYYLYSMALFGFFPKYYFLAWGGIALLSPIAGHIAWYARGTGWLAALCACLLIALLFVEGYSFFYTGSIPRGLDILSGLFLIVVLGSNNRQRARIFVVSAIVFVIFWKLDILPWLFGGI